MFSRTIVEMLKSNYSIEEQILLSHFSDSVSKKVFSECKVICKLGKAGRKYMIQDSIIERTGLPACHVSLKIQNHHSCKPEKLSTRILIASFIPFERNAATFSDRVRPLMQSTRRFERTVQSFSHFSSKQKIQRGVWMVRRRSESASIARKSTMGTQ